MAELPVITGKEAVAALKRAGFSVVRIKGSHHIMKSAGRELFVNVPVHAGRNLKRGTLRRIIRDAGLTVAQFCGYL